MCRKTRREFSPIWIKSLRRFEKLHNLYRKERRLKKPVSLWKSSYNSPCILEVFFSEININSLPTLIDTCWTNMNQVELWFWNFILLTNNQGLSLFWISWLHSCEVAKMGITGNNRKQIWFPKYFYQAPWAPGTGPGTGEVIHF